MKKMSWGTGIAIAAGVFVVAILAVVAVTMTHRVDLVTDNYYEKELRYEDRIRAKQRAASTTFALNARQTPSTIEITFPRLSHGGMYRGSMMLYSAANRNDDISVPVVPDTCNRQVLPTAGLRPGAWRLKVEWKADTLDCYAEYVVRLPFDGIPVNGELHAE